MKKFYAIYEQNHVTISRISNICKTWNLEIRRCKHSIVQKVLICIPLGKYFLSSVIVDQKLQVHGSLRLNAKGTIF